jgi:hypothetical protein
MSRFGAKRFDPAIALRLAGKRGEVHPLDIAAFVYPSMEKAERAADANRKLHRHYVLGPIVTEIGPVNIIDFRPAFARIHADAGTEYRPTDPNLPDNYQPPVTPRSSNGSRA